MTFTRNLLSDAVRYSLAAGAVSLCGLATAPAFAQDATIDNADADKAKNLDTITVVGSRIPQAQKEGSNPVTIIQRKDLEVRGDLSVADVLRSSTFNSFGSLRESSGNTAGSQATINLRGLGSQRSLILLDGRRIASSPVLGAAAQNLNSIPFAAVERIEILRNGASAIYGSDAIAGVINVVLRKDFEGLTISAGIERPTRGEPDANSGSIVGGVSSDKGNITFVLDHQERDIYFNRDRPTSSGPNPAVGLSAFGFPPSAILYGTNPDGSIDPYDFRGIRPDPACPTALGSDPNFPNSVRVGSFCRYNYNSQAANEAALKRDSLLVNANFDLSDNVSAFTRVTMLNSIAFGRYAPTPFTNFPTVAADNPNNPFPGNALKLFYRFVPGGSRDSTTRDNMLDVLFGLHGHLDWFGGTDWEASLHHNNYNINSIGTGYGLGPPLQGLIDSGAFNPFASGVNDPANIAAVASVSHTILQFSHTRTFGGDFQVNGRMFDMSGGSAKYAAGVQYEDTAYTDLVDAQSAAGNVLGTAGGNSGGERQQFAGYVEMNFPILSNLSIDVAARYDHYNDFGSTVNPKFGIEYRPFESLLLRASYGTGFRAPDLASLNAAPAQTFLSATDIFNCPDGVDLTGGGLPFNPCLGNQYEASIRSNPNLGPERSKNYSAGIVFSPTADLSFSLDYYRIKLKDQIRNLSIQSAINIDTCANPRPGYVPSADFIAFCATLPPALPPGATVTRNANGSLNFIVLPAFSAGGFDTSGYDFVGDWKLDTPLGTFNPSLQVSYVKTFRTKIFDTDPYGNALGFTSPKLKATGFLGWSKGDFGATAVANLIGKSTQQGSSTIKFPYFTTFDLQGTWKTPWNGKVTMGVRNIADRTPPLSSRLPTPFYLNSQYDFYGRVPYLRYEQSF
ncbi:MAG: TonB-dependent receptor [Lysobacteraceae bacterium]